MNGFPSEEHIPTDPVAIYELLVAARLAKISPRYINVLRHRLMDTHEKEARHG